VLITFLTDFGLEDDFVGTCHGVMKRIAPDVEIIDITHGIHPQGVLQGGLVLANTIPYLPVGVHLAVVDPGVGSDRRAIAVRGDDGRFYVGPDNGLLVSAFEKLGGVAAVHELTNRAYALEPVSATFHGRDIFSPVAAHLALGTPFESVGPEIPVGSLVQLPPPRVEVGDGELRTDVLFVDSFGNIRFAAVPVDLVEAIGDLKAGRRVVVEIERNGSGPVTERTTWEQTFGRVQTGASLLYQDSSGHVALSDNQANAAARLGVTSGARAVIRAH
jgi:S-adenosylmethionine hydrolase